MATINYQCMICNSTYKTTEMESELETGRNPEAGGKPGVSHGYCSKDCFRIYLIAAEFCTQEEVEEFMEGNTFDRIHSISPVSLEQVIEKMQRNSAKHK